MAKHLEYVWYADGRLQGGGEMVWIFLWNSVGWTDSKNVMNQVCKGLYGWNPLIHK